MKTVIRAIPQFNHKRIHRQFEKVEWAGWFKFGAPTIKKEGKGWGERREYTPSEIAALLHYPRENYLYVAESTGKYMETTNEVGVVEMWCEMEFEMKCSVYVEKCHQVEVLDKQGCIVDWVRRVAGRPVYKMVTKTTMVPVKQVHSVTVMVPERAITFVDLQEPKKEMFNCGGQDV